MTGFLLLLLGVWGAVIPFVGPYFNYAYTPDTTWMYTTGRLWMEIVPGAVTFVCGLILLTTALRPAALTAASLAAAAGAWFVIGPVVRPLWSTTAALNPGVPAGSTILLRVVEQIGFFTGLGVVIVFLAAIAFGRHAVVTGVHRRVAPVEEEEPVAA